MQYDLLLLAKGNLEREDAVPLFELLDSVILIQKWLLSTMWKRFCYSHLKFLQNKALVYFQ